MPNDIPYNKKAAESSDEYMKKNPNGPSFSDYIRGLAQKMMPNQATSPDQQAAPLVPTAAPQDPGAQSMPTDKPTSQFGATYDYDMNNANDNDDEIEKAAIKKAALQRVYGNNS